jgi:hypothetical protein
MYYIKKAKKVIIYIVRNTEKKDRQMNGWMDGWTDQ